MPKDYVIQDSRLVEYKSFSVLLVRSTNLLTSEVQLTATIVRYNGASRDVIIPDEIESHTVVEIAPGAFMCNQYIQRVRLQSNITRIGESAFQNCRNMSSIQMTRAMGKSLSKELTLDRYAFAGCASLSEISFPHKELTPQSLHNIIYLPRLHSLHVWIKELDAGSLKGCGLLRKIYLADNCIIHKNALKNLPELTSVQLEGNCDIGQLGKRELSALIKKTIFCPSDSNMVELMHLGARVETLPST